MIIGHNKIISFLNKTLQSGNISHAYLFSGPEHVGKFTVALDWAGKILGDTSELNPDLIILRPEIEEKGGAAKKKAITVEEIRELQRKVVISPGEKHKVIIIDDADYLNKSSQNALLKTLEEPPTRTILILISSDTEKLLPTIISRCQIKKFNPVSSDEIGQMIGNCEHKEDVIFWSLGRPGLAVRMTQEKAPLEERKDSLMELKKIFSMSVSERFALAETMSKDVSKMMEKLDWWTVILRQCLLGNERILNVSQAAALKLLDAIGESIWIIKNTNSNARLVMENTMLEF